MSTDPTSPTPAVESTLPPPRQRHPLGLPPGSVRALLVLMVMGTIAILLAMPPEREIRVPLYLYYLLFLTTGAYFANRSQSHTQESAPLGLPRGSIRGLLMLAFFGVMGFAVYRESTAFLERPLLAPNDQHATLLLPGVILTAYMAGTVVSAILRRLLAGPAGMPAWYQDMLAWVSLLAVLGLGAQVIFELVVAPSMANPPSLPNWELILSAVVAFYFGARA